MLFEPRMTAIELDHFFICASPGAPEADHLISLGLVEGAPNDHPGQGTANRRFFFTNTMLELVYLRSAEEARSALTARTLLADRCERRHEVSPFGFIVRPVAGTADQPPFEAWEYRPAYLPPPMFMYVADAGLEEPMWVYADFLRARAHSDVAHPCGMRELTGVRLTSPVPPSSSATLTIVSAGILEWQEGAEHLLDLEFDGARLDRHVDLRPHLPLRFRW
jgi:hypothetical protein